MPYTGKRQAWKMHELVDELQTWSTYLQTSVDRFNAEIKQHNNAKADEVAELLTQLKKSVTVLKTKAKKLRPLQPRT